MTKIIVTTDRALTEKQRQMVQQMLADVFPDDQGLVLDGGFKLQELPPSYRELAAMHIMASLIVARPSLFASEAELPALAWKKADALIAARDA